MYHQYSKYTFEKIKLELILAAVDTTCSAVNLTNISSHYPGLRVNEMQILTDFLSTHTHTHTHINHSYQFISEFRIQFLQ